MAKKDKKDNPAAQEALKPSGPPRLKTQYAEQVSAALAEHHGLKNPMSRPKIDKIVLNVNVGRHLENNKLPANVKESVLETLNTVTGQKPIVILAKLSVSNFKVREGAETAAAVTLRRDRMWHFLDRFINLVAPRIKDFRGLPVKSFDGAGNYSFGLHEQSVFPEVDMSQVNFIHGMNINIVFNNSNPVLSRFVLDELGMPFRKADAN
jgi:large subunit ribosomal protein L5